MNAACEVPGLQYVSGYLAPEDQVDFLHYIDQQPWITDLKRRVQHYGYRYDYKTRSVDQAMYLGALPPWLLPLTERLHSDGHSPAVPNQVIINEYQPGQGIANHVDCVPCFGDTILSITLASACVMEFTHIPTHEVVPVWVEPGSLIVMQGEARYQWKHGIPARKTDVYEGQSTPRGRRVSMTFREVKTKN